MRRAMFRVADIVQLKEIDLRGPQALQRALELVAVGRFELCRDKQLIAQARGRGHIANDLLDVAIGRRRVDKGAAVIDQCLDHRARALPGSRIVGVENLGGAEADGGQGLTARRNRARDERRRRLRRRRPDHASRCQRRHRRYCELVISRARCCLGFHDLGAAFLRPPEGHREDKPANRNRRGDERDCAEL
jgi:hypothetical protein